MTLENSTLSGNSAAPQNGGDGGGIFNVAFQIPTTVIVNNSTLSGNSAAAGGAILNEAFEGGVSEVTVSNSTLSGNSAEEYGGGVENVGFYNGSATVTLNNSTFSGNSGAFGGGIDNYASTGNGGQGTIEIANTILNAGASGENINNESATVVSHGYNLSSDAVGGDKTAVPGGLLNGPGDIRNTNPMLGPLQNNGGPTMTHALLDHSPATDRGDPNFNPNLFNPPLLYDQRGLGFPRIVGGRVDIGAYEAKHR